MIPHSAAALTLVLSTYLVTASRPTVAVRRGDRAGLELEHEVQRKFCKDFSRHECRNQACSWDFASQGCIPFDTCLQHEFNDEACLEEKASSGQGACLFRSSPKGCVPMLPANCPGTNRSMCRGLCEYEWTQDWKTSCKAKKCFALKDEAMCNAAGGCLFRSKPLGCVDMKPENCRGVAHSNCKEICVWKNVPDKWEISCKAACSAYKGDERLCSAGGCLFTASMDCVEMLPENCPGVNHAHCKGVCKRENIQGTNTCKATCSSWEGNAAKCNAAGGCLFRSKPFGCTDMKAENCPGVNRTNCKGVCEWEEISKKWEISCKAKPKITPKPSGEGRSAARKGKQGINWAAIFAVGALIFILCGVACCCCGGSRSSSTGSQATWWEMGWTPVTVQIPPEVHPGQAFQFTHPRTGQLMQAIAPMDGARVVAIQS